MMSTSTGERTRAELLAAAVRVVRRDGPMRLTLDAVASESGRSKGGVLYHFPTKDALLAGLIEQYLSEFEEAVATSVARDPPRPGRLLRAFVNASLDLEPIGVDEGSALAAAIANNPGLLAPVQASTALWQTRLEADGIDPTLATVIRLAVDGVVFADVFGLAPLRPEARAHLRTALLGLIDASSR